jgi:hypothetical protein
LSEYVPFRQALEIILETTRMNRMLIPLNLPYLRALTVVMESVMPGFPLSTFWVDYCSNNRTCAVDTIPRLFGFLPARFTYRLEHLKNINWARSALQTFFMRHK